MLGFGLYYFFGPWIETIYTYVLFNNFGFSVALGLPLFIVLTSDSVNLICAENEESKYELLTRWKKTGNDSLHPVDDCHCGRGFDGLAAGKPNCSGLFQWNVSAVVTLSAIIEE